MKKSKSLLQNKTLLFIPTYNEAENVEKIFQRIQLLGLDTDILFMDDHTPAETGKIIDRIAAANK